MPCTTTTRWTVPASKETDISLRCFLAELGMQKGDISKFIGDAVKWRMFDQTMDETRKQVVRKESNGIRDIVATKPWIPQASSGYLLT